MKKITANQRYRFFQKDGSVRIRRTGVAAFDRISWYNALIQMTRWKLWFTLITTYIVLNLIFAAAYFYIGIEYIEGTRQGSDVMNFAQAFFFSAQTFTTVGYGHISPTGLLTNAIAAFEAFIGLLCFAMVSGIFYARFAKPKPFLHFSDVALISPHKGNKALVFRVVPYKDHYLVDAEVKVSLVIRNETGHNDFFSLAIDLRRVDALVLNWTIIHPITEESPLFNKPLEQLRAEEAEIFVFLKAHDEVYANPVVARTSYTTDDIIENARFKRMYHPSDKGNETILHIDMLNDYEIVETRDKV
jgi:inward rectifier potassium channel